MGDHYCLSRVLIQALHDKGLYVLKQFMVQGNTPSTCWPSAVSIDLPFPLGIEWELYRLRLIDSGIFLQNLPDRLIWSANTSLGTVTAPLAYEYLLVDSDDREVTGVDKLIWNNTLPLKIGCFIWLCLQNKILTWPNLQGRGFCGPRICILCLTGDDHIDHVFGRCVFFQHIWSTLRHRCHELPLWEGDSIRDNLSACLDHLHSCTFLSFFALWEVWRARNGLLFGGYTPQGGLIVARILAWPTFDVMCPDHDMIRLAPQSEDHLTYPFGLFDGAS